LAEPLGGAVGLLEAVSFEEAMESVCNARPKVTFPAAEHHCPLTVTKL